MLDLKGEGTVYDVRLVYLALLNMFKHRGHFLLSTENEELNTEQIDIA